MGTKAESRGVRLIPLSQGQFAKVDHDDFERINKYKWSAHWTPNTKSYRAVRCENKKIQVMSRIIMEAPPGMVVDHIDHDTLNNQKYNLRIVTIAQNQKNRGKQKNNVSGYKGVSWHKGARKWQAGIGFNKKRIGLGIFNDKLSAAHAYDAAAKKYHGEFASTNF